MNASCLSAVRLPDSRGGNWLPRKMLQLSGMAGDEGKCKSFHSCSAWCTNCASQNSEAQGVRYKEDSPVADRYSLRRSRGHAILDAIKILRGGFVRWIRYCCFVKSATRPTQEGRNSWRYPETQLS